MVLETPELAAGEDGSEGSLWLCPSNRERWLNLRTQAGQGNDGSWSKWNKVYSKLYLRAHALRLPARRETLVNPVTDKKAGARRGKVHGEAGKGAQACLSPNSGSDHCRALPLAGTLPPSQAWRSPTWDVLGN